jgi:hypothetical protein
MEHCPNCGAGELKIIAAVLERPVTEKILTDLGLDPQPPPKGRTREAGQVGAGQADLPLCCGDGAPARQAARITRRQTIEGGCRDEIPDGA